MEEIAYKVSVDTGEGGKSLKSLKQDFKDAQKELDGLEVGTRDYVKALEKLGGIRDNIGDLNQEINAFNPEGKVKAFGNVIGGLASGFQAAQGAAALFGGANKEVEKTLLKVQAAMAFAEGIKGVMSLGDSFKVLGNILKANPLIMIATIIVGIGVALYALKDKIKFVGDAFDAIGDVIGWLIQQVKDFTDWLGITSFAMDKMGDSVINSSKRIQKATTERYDSEIAEAKRAGKETELLEIAKLAAITKTNDAIIAQLRARQAASGSLNEEDKKLLDEKVGENRKAYQDILNLSDAYKDREIANQQKITTSNTAELQKRHDEEVRIRAETQKMREEILINQLAFEQQVLDEEALAKQTAHDNDVSRVSLFTEEETKAHEKRQAQAELDAFHNKGYLDIQLEDLNAKMEKELSNTELTEKQKLLIKENYAAQARALEQADTNAKLQLASNLNSALVGLSDAFFAVKRSNLVKGSKADLDAAKKQFNINKALSISGAVITGIQSVMAAYASGLATPVIGPATGAVYAVLAGVMAAANIAKIAASKFDPGGGGASGGGASVATSIPQPPTIAAPTTGSTQLNADGTIKKNDTQQPMVKAIVVETDITKNQKRVSSIETNAKL